MIHSLLLLSLPLAQALSLVNHHFVKEDFAKLIQNQHEKNHRIAHAQVGPRDQPVKLPDLDKRAPLPSSSSFLLYEYYYQGADLAYLIEVDIGTPPQKVYVQFDTGSNTLWANSPNAATGASGSESFSLRPPRLSLRPQVQTYYDPSKSSTENNTNTPFSITYGKGSASGIYYEDTISVGNYTVTSRPFGLDTRTDTANTGSPISGIIGMASSTLTTSSIPTYFEDLIQNNVLAQPYFSVYLPRGVDLGIEGLGSANTLTSGGEVCFGCMVASPRGYTVGNLNWTPVTTFGFWQVLVDGWIVNGKAVAGTSCQGMLDTGSSFISLPSATATALFAPLNGMPSSDGTWAIPVSSLKSSSTFAISIGGIKYNIDLADLVLSYTDSSERYYLLSVLSGDDSVDPNGAPLAVLGDTFLKNVISSYSYSQNGAPAIGLQQLTSTTSDTTGLDTITGSVAPTGVVPGPVGGSTRGGSTTGPMLGGGDATQTATSEISGTATGGEVSSGCENQLGGVWGKIFGLLLGLGVALSL